MNLGPRSRRFALRSMRSRMTFGFALATAMLLALVCGGLLLWTRQATRRAADEMLDQNAREIAREASERPFSPGAVAFFTREEAAELRDLNLALLIVDSGGRVLAQSQKRVPPWPLPESDRDNWRVRAVPWGSRTLVLAVPWREVRRREREFALILAGLSLTVIAASGAGAWLLVGRTLSPIGLLAEQAKSASAEGIGVRLSPPSPDAEVTGLVATLNGLLESQAQAAQAKGRFYAAASHELRTPLQALSGFLEFGLSRPRPREELESTLREAQEQSDRLISLVQELLLLNQLDMTTAKPPAQEIDVPDVAERLLAQMQPEIQARGLRIEKNWGGEGEILAPSQHVEMLLRNVLENAVKYAASGSEVRLSWAASTWEAWNECALAEGWDESKYFEPFFRPDASRHSSTGGNGLGLAICRALCESNGWAITLQQQEAREGQPGGVRVRVRMEPGAPANSAPGDTKRPK